MPYRESAFESAFPLVPEADSSFRASPVSALTGGMQAAQNVRTGWDRQKAQDLVLEQAQAKWDALQGYEPGGDLTDIYRVSPDLALKIEEQQKRLPLEQQKKAAENLSAGLDLIGKVLPIVKSTSPENQHLAYGGMMELMKRNGFPLDGILLPADKIPQDKLSGYVDSLWGAYRNYSTMKQQVAGEQAQERAKILVQGKVATAGIGAAGRAATSKGALYVSVYNSYINQGYSPSEAAVMTEIDMAAAGAEGKSQVAKPPPTHTPEQKRNIEAGTAAKEAAAKRAEIDAKLKEAQLELTKKIASAMPPVQGQQPPTGQQPAPAPAPTPAQSEPKPIQKPNLTPPPGVTPPSVDPRLRRPINKGGSSIYSPEGFGWGTWLNDDGSHSWVYIGRKAQ